MNRIKISKREPKKTHDTVSLNILTSGLLSPCWAAASSSRSKSHLTGGGKWGGTFRIVPKKSSTNFWIVPLVESSRVRKISGMDLWERAAKQETINDQSYRIHYSYKRNVRKPLEDNFSFEFVRISARHPRGGPLPSGSNEENKSGARRVVYLR